MNVRLRVALIVIVVVALACVACYWLVAWVSLPRVCLEGVDIPGRAQLGEPFPVTLLLRPPKRFEMDCRLFIHFQPEGCEGPIINADCVLPVPSTRWIPGEVQRVGPFKCSVPEGGAAGSYAVEAGLFYSGRDFLGRRRLVRVPYSNRKRFNWRIGSVELVRKPPRRYRQADFNRGYAVGYAGPLEKVFPEKTGFYGPIAETVSLTAAGNERESFQLVIIPDGRPLKGLRIDLEELRRRGGGGVIARENVTVRLVGYVKTRTPYYNVIRVGLWPDPLIPFEGSGVVVTPERVQPLWVDVSVPAGTPAGDYEGGITIQPGGLDPVRVALSLRVWGFSLPTRASLKSGFDFYEYILRNYYPKRADETPDDWKVRIAGICRRYYLDMLDHRISPIHNVGNPVLRGLHDGTYELDFSAFGEKVEFYTRSGQTDFGIAKEARIDPEYDVWSKAWYGFTGPKAVREVFGEFGRYLERHGWLGRAYTYIIDESYKGVKSLTRLIHQGHPGIRNLATMPPRDGYPDVDIWCVRINKLDREVIKRFRDRGKEIWMYVASPTRPFPTIILDSPSLETRVLPWICWRNNVQGFLYWCVNYWHLSNPWDDPMTWPEQNGNGSLFYPGAEGPVDSIRLEVLRDGFEDYEYLRTLSEIGGDPALEERIGKAVTSSWQYTDSPAVLLALRQAIAERISASISEAEHGKITKWKPIR
jgi:hypothetical protein